MTEGGAVADAKRDAAGTDARRSRRDRRRSGRSGAALGGDLRRGGRHDRVPVDAGWATGCASCSTTRSRANPTCRRWQAGAPPTTWRRTCRSSTGDALLSRARRPRPGAARRRRRARPGVHVRWRPARPGRRALRPLPDESARRLSAHRCGVPRATRRRAADGRARRRRRRRDHRLTGPVARR